VPDKIGVSALSAYADSPDEFCRLKGKERSRIATRIGDRVHNQSGSTRATLQGVLLKAVLFGVVVAIAWFRLKGA
jgi:hypothetical protein